MASIKVCIDIKQGPEKVFDFVRTNFKKFPEFMKNVQQLDVIDSANNKYITEWWVDVDGMIVKWKEEDVFDHKKLAISFKMLDGDYKNYEGHWNFEQIKVGTRLEITAIFDWGIPVLEAHVVKVLDRKAKTSFKGMLKALKKEMENSQ